jgi:hypothetical protein
VVGGGDSAAEEAVYLTKYASKVHLLVRGEKMRASKAMADRAMATPKVQLHFNTAVEDAYGNGVLQVGLGGGAGLGAGTAAHSGRRRGKEICTCGGSSDGEGVRCAGTGKGRSREEPSWWE